MKIEVIRSQNRRKTISARLEGDTLVVRAPAQISQKDLDDAIAKLSTRLQSRRRRHTLSDDDLEQRARLLNRRLFDDALRWQSIRWVTNQNKRFGSCTPSDGTIRISQRVGEMPLWVQDYVIVHELAHLREANHGPRFWKLVNRYGLTERARGYLMALGIEDDESDASRTPEGA